MGSSYEVSERRHSDLVAKGEHKVADVRRDKVSTSEMLDPRRGLGMSSKLLGGIWGYIEGLRRTSVGRPTE